MAYGRVSETLAELRQIEAPRRDVPIQGFDMPALFGRVLQRNVEHHGVHADVSEREVLCRRRLLDEEVHYLTTLQQHRIIPHSAKVKGWTVTPSHYLNNQLDTVWLAE